MPHANAVPTTRPFLRAAVRLATVLACVALSLAPRARAADAAPRAPEERWYVVRMMDQKAGWMHETEDEVPADEPGAPANLRSRSQISLKVGRAEVSIEVTISSEFVETPAGMPVRMRSEQRLGALPMVSEFVWKGAAVEITESQAGRETKRTEAWPPPGAEDVLTPGAAARLFEEKSRAGERTLTARTIDPMGGITPVTVTRTRKDELGDKAEAFGKTVPAQAWGTTQSVAPGVESIEWLDAQGELVRGDTNLGGLTLTLLRADKDIALLPADAPEIMASTLVTPNKPIARPRELKQATYIVRVREGELPDLPTTASQRFERIDAKSARVIVGDKRFRAAVAPEDLTNSAYRSASSMIDSDDPIVRAIALAAPRPLPTQAERHYLDSLRKAAHASIRTKSLDVGFASASEVARTHEGDCTEHAMLLAAMMRAVEIPSRCVTGLIYVDEFAGKEGVFGFHMWAQAMTIDGGAVRHWVDVDATLPGESGFDAAHITLAVSAMSDDDRVNSLAAVAPLIGRLEIDVEEVEYKPLTIQEQLTP